MSPVSRRRPRNFAGNHVAGSKTIPATKGLNSMSDEFSATRVVGAVAVGIVAIAALAVTPKLFENVNPDEMVVIQSPVDGRLDWYTTAGMKWQGFGDVTTYYKRSTYEFMPIGEGGGRKLAGGIEVRFNDGGHGTMFGSVQFEMPQADDKLNLIHSRYRTMDQVKKQLIETVTNKAIYLVGTLMSSKESYAEKRNDLIHLVADQIQNGIYRTRQKREWIKDPITGVDKEIVAAEIVMGRDGHPERQEESVLNYYGIRSFNFTIVRLPYDESVEAQIKQQQQITMDIQTSIAEKLKAEQRALTVEQQGRADATYAKWKQEVEKATAVTRAEQEKIVATTNAEREQHVAEIQGRQRLAVAELDRQSAEQTKLTQILLGEGEATRKKLVLDADGALELKAATWIKGQEVWAAAFKGSKWTPDILFAGAAGSSAGASNVQTLIDLFTTKAARDLSFDLTVTPPRK